MRKQFFIVLLSHHQPLWLAPYQPSTCIYSPNRHKCFTYIPTYRVTPYIPLDILMCMDLPTPIGTCEGVVAKGLLERLSR